MAAIRCRSKSNLKRKDLVSLSCGKSQAKFLNRDKLSTPTIVNGTEKIIFSLYFLQCILPLITRQTTMIAPYLTSSLSWSRNLMISLSRYRNFLDLLKDLTNGPMIVLKTFIPELSPILVKLFTCCLKENCFPSLQKMSAVCIEEYRGTLICISILTHQPSEAC